MYVRVCVRVCWKHRLIIAVSFVLLFFCVPVERNQTTAEVSHVTYTPCFCFVFVFLVGWKRVEENAHNERAHSQPRSEREVGRDGGQFRPR